MDDGFPEAMANQEVERYAYRAPEQVTSCFYGYQRLMEMRRAAPLALRERFDRQDFNDSLLAQGLLPPAPLKRAVFESFVMQAAVPRPADAGD